MSERTPHLLLEDILDAAQRIVEYTAGMTFEEFAEDNKTVDAVIRNIEVIGEATHLLPYEFKLKYSEIDWIRIRGFRNRIVHDYFGVDLEIVWQITTDYLPGLITGLSDILSAI